MGGSPQALGALSSAWREKGGQQAEGARLLACAPACLRACLPVRGAIYLDGYVSPSSWRVPRSARRKAVSTSLGRGPSYDVDGQVFSDGGARCCGHWMTIGEDQERTGSVRRR